MITADRNKIFRRIHDGFIMGENIVLGIDYSTGIARLDKAEYYEQIPNPDKMIVLETYVSDQQLNEMTPMFPNWINGEKVWAKDGTKPADIRNFNSQLYKCVQSHTTQADWTPDLTPALWTKVSIEEFPQWVQPLGSEDAYNTGDKVTYNGLHYQSLIDANVWSPDAYPAGWQLMA